MPALTELPVSEKMYVALPAHAAFLSIVVCADHAMRIVRILWRRSA